MQVPAAAHSACPVIRNGCRPSGHEDQQRPVQRQHIHLPIGTYKGEGSVVYLKEEGVSLVITDSDGREIARHIMPPGAARRSSTATISGTGR